MGLILEYIQELPSGGVRYRRRVPKPLVAALGKREVLRHLGKTKVEALKSYLAVHHEVERLFHDVASNLAGGGAPGGRSTHGGSDYAEHRRLIDKLRKDGFEPTEDPGSIGENMGRQLLADRLLDEHPIDPRTGEARVPPQEAAYIRALYNGPAPTPAPSLTDAMVLYLSEYAKTDSAEHHKKRQRIERVVANAKDALGGDRKLTEITWHDARAVTAHLLSRGGSPETTRRYLNDLMGIASLAIEANRLGISNPFAGIVVESDPTLSKEGRKDVPEQELEDAVDAVRLRLQLHASPDLVNIWAMLEHTGCRGKEITGLEKADVFVGDPRQPYILIRWTENRRLKSRATARGLPLVPSVVAAVKSALEQAGDSPYLFPNYHSGQGGSDRASAALGKHVRAVTKNPRIVTYSLRHRIKAKMGVALVSDDLQEKIMGHASGKTSRQYGLSEVERIAMGTALEKALGRQAGASEDAVENNGPRLLEPGYS